ncbi:MAG TPA: DUF3365 domain-containing protein [Deltaproteobacteria bacterium]|nr:DUF3365 domain-containing protein [Deltaproteobacteria bacterium]
MWLWMLAGCWNIGQDLTTETTTAESLALEAARQLASTSAEQLQTQMVQELGNPGPPNAILEGSSESEALNPHSGLPSPGNGRIGHSSLRPRDPANRAPDWVQPWLDAHRDAEFSDVQGTEQIVEGPGGSVARVLLPIPMLDTCVRCHGSEAQIPADVRTRLEARYPDDQATGFAVGDLMGALWVELPVEG